METLTQQTVGSKVISTAGFSLEKLPSLLLRFSNSLKKQGKSRHTISAYSNDLSLFTRFLQETGYNPESFDSDVTVAWIEFLKKHGRVSAASVRRAQMSVRTLMRYLISIRVIVASPFLEVKSPRQPSHDLLVILPQHFVRLVETLTVQAESGDIKAVRDLALVLILGVCGLKASECANLTWGDVLFDKDGGALRVRGEIERLVSFGDEVAHSLVSLRDLRVKLGISSSLDAKLFFGFFNLTRKVRTPFLHRHGIKFVIYEICHEIIAVPYNSESLRNHAIVCWLAEGLGDERVAELAGYSSLNSLERFSVQTRELRKPLRRMDARKTVLER